MPILEPELADTSELPRIMSHYFEPTAQDTRGEPQIVGPIGIPWLFRLART
jgi:hypothetical protein